jgi:predicted phosphohydrolase
VRVAWLTDIHLDFLSPTEIAAFGASIDRERADAVLITGDISVAPALASHLSLLVSSWRAPCYFVAGNHDYYGSSIELVRRGLRAIESFDPRLRWLPAQGVVRLTRETSLVGIDGWADGRLGDPEGTRVVLNDHIRIAELRCATRGELLAKVRDLGDAEAAALRRLLGEALAPSRRVIVAMHIPPFRESSTYQGRISGDDWLPWMTCHAVGQVLLEMARDHPDREIVVLAGHTHDRCEIHPLPNLAVRTGAVEYGAPAIQEILALD